MLLKEQGRLAGIEENLPVEVQVIGIGDARIVGLPGEIFAEFGMTIQYRAPFGKVFVVELANGMLPGIRRHHAGLCPGRVRDRSLDADRQERRTDGRGRRAAALRDLTRRETRPPREELDLMIRTNLQQEAIAGILVKGACCVPPDVRAAFTEALAREEEDRAREAFRSTLRSLGPVGRAHESRMPRSGWPLFFVKAGDALRT